MHKLDSSTLKKLVCVFHRASAVWNAAIIFLLIYHLTLKLQWKKAEVNSCFMKTLSEMLVFDLHDQYGFDTLLKGSQRIRVVVNI